jgi:hypothetical protein
MVSLPMKRHINTEGRGPRYSNDEVRVTMRTLKGSLGGLSAALLMAAALSGCADDKIVYRDRPLFETPAATAAGFVGYQSTTSKTPTCGACHVTVLGEWKETAHAGAWATLQANPGKKAYCEACHTVNNRGNAKTDTLGGWNTTKDARYQDVQCESCHGAAVAHITNPTKTNVPLVSMKATAGFSDGCGACHTGVHTPFLQEWQASGHGKMQLSASAVSRGVSCDGCHTGQGALRDWGVAVRTNYKEKAMGRGDTLTITCAVCHDPHAKNTSGQLRFPINVANVDQNLCMKCHQKRSVPEINSTRAAHSPEGPLLVGDFGWVPPDFQMPAGLDKITTTHGSQANPRLCAGCHVSKFTVTDATGAFQTNYTGHRFLSTPCVDANGAPTIAQDCTGDKRSFKSCTGSGCHGSENAARSAEAIALTRVRTLALEVNRLVALARIARPSDFSITDNRITTGEGAAWNSASVYNATTGKPTAAIIHNPYLVEALLTSSIAQLKKDYNIAVTAGLNLENTYLQK